MDAYDPKAPSELLIRQAPGATAHQRVWLPLLAETAVPGAEPAGKASVAAAPTAAIAEEPVDYPEAEELAVPDAPMPTPRSGSRSNAPAPVENQAPLMTVEAALDRIGEAVLADFKKQFNGKPTEMRHIDAKDRIFENEKES